LLIMAFWIGLYPKPFFEILEQPVNQLVLKVRPDYPVRPGVMNAVTQPALQQPASAPVSMVAHAKKGSN
jgi:hypothetical protein